MVTSAQTSQTVAPPKAPPKIKILGLSTLFRCMYPYTWWIGQTWHLNDHLFPGLSSSENRGETSTQIAWDIRNG